MNEPAPHESTLPGPSERKSARTLATLFASVFVIATNGVIYELLIAGYSSYLLGDSITQFSLTIGVFLSAMGLGSYLTRFLRQGLLDAFIGVELLIGLFGGPSILVLFAAYQMDVAYAAAMLTLAALVGLLIGFEIPIVARIAAERSTFRKAIADVLSLDYIGALLGALLFPLVLLPSFGFTATSFVIGLANVLVAAANLFSFWGQLRSPRVLVIATVLVGAALVAGLIAAPDLRAAIEAQRR